MENQETKAGFCLSQKTVDFQLLWMALIDISGLRQYEFSVMPPDFDENESLWLVVFVKSAFYISLWILYSVFKPWGT